MEMAYSASEPLLNANPMPATGTFPSASSLRFPTALVDAQGRLLQSNPAWDALPGTVPGKARPWLDAFHRDDRPDLARYLQRADAGPRECRLLTGEGERWVLLELHPAATPIGQPPAWLCTCVDIHARKQAESASRRLQSIQADMLDVSVDCIKLIDLEGHVVHMNKAGCQALGVDGGSGFGMPWLPLLPQDIRADGQAALHQCRAGRPSRFPGRSQIQGQPAQHWDNQLTPVLDDKGAVCAILCISREVTAEREALAAQECSRQRLAIAVRVGGLGIWDYDIASDALHCDEAWYRIMGREGMPPVRSIADLRPLVHPEDRDKATEVADTTAALIATDQDYVSVFRIIRGDGEIRWLRSLACLQHEQGKPLRATGFIVDITEAWHGTLALRDANRALAEQTDALTRQLRLDPLTGIANRRHLDHELARLCDEARTRGSSLCVGMIDVDHFKQFNDRYGHLAGDHALRRIATTLDANVRESDFVARYGGEEFVFVLVGVRTPDAVIQSLVAAVTGIGIAHADSPGGVLSISCGAVFAAEGGLSAQQLLEASDQALYEAKLGGRNGWRLRHLPRECRVSG